MSHKPGLVTVLVLSILLAGCGGKANDAPPSHSASGPGDVPLLSGYVLDAAVEPVVGALVSVHGTNSTTLTQGDGSYKIDEVPVGAPIVVVVEASGFVSSSKSVTIPEESFVVLNFTLAPIPVKTPYVDYFPIEGFVSCQVVVVAQGDTRLTDCSMGVDPNNEPLLTFNVNPDLASIVFELEWEPASAAAETLNLSAETVNFGDADKVIAQGIGSSILKVQVSESLARQYYGGSGGTVRVRVSAGAEPAASEANAGASGHVQQDFTLHVSNFYVNGPDPNYSALTAA